MDSSYGPEYTIFWTMPNLLIQISNFVDHSIKRKNYSVPNFLGFFFIVVVVVHQLNVNLQQLFQITFPNPSPHHAAGDSSFSKYQLYIGAMYKKVWEWDLKQMAGQYWSLPIAHFKAYFLGEMLKLRDFKILGPS